MRILSANRQSTPLGTRIAFISPCGFGNLGDAAIQDTFIASVRWHLGAATEIVGITQNPPDTEERHHVRAVPMDNLAFRLRRRAPAEGLSEANVGATRRGAARRAVGRAKQLVKEVVHWGIAFREMRRADALVVSGGGQLDDHWGGPWRVPYALWKWTLVARLLRNDVVFLSVGAGTTDSRLTRFFLRSALGRARYASFRDEHTAARVRSLRLSASSRIVPDLAFGHGGRRGYRERSKSQRRRTIAISPIAFLDPVAWPAKDANRYRFGLHKTAELAVLLINKGYDVLVCTSDTPDVKSASELRRAVSDIDPQRSSQISYADTRTPKRLLETFGRADVAIASRLHGLILANLAGAPTIALSYDWKVDEHMRTVGLERFVFPIGTFEPSLVVAAVDEIIADHERIAAMIAEQCATLAAEVDSQFEDVFAPWGGGRFSASRPEE